jgi:hypothetical protein
MGAILPTVVVFEAAWIQAGLHEMGDGGKHALLSVSLRLT